MTEMNRKAFYLVTAILGIGLLMVEIDLYRRTLIPFSVPLSITLIFTLITFFIIKDDYKKTYEKSALFYPLLQSLISFGFIACFCFMALNFYLAENDSETFLLSIKSKHTIGTKNRRPVIEVDYNGFSKQFYFYTRQQQKIDASDSVLVTVQKGLFGYDIFKSINLPR